MLVLSVCEALVKWERLGMGDCGDEAKREDCVKVDWSVYAVGWWRMDKVAMKRALEDRNKVNSSHISLGSVGFRLFSGGLEGAVAED